MKTSEQRKKVYELLEKEGLADLLTATKEYVGEFDDVDAKRRKAEDQLKLYGDTDPEEFKEMQNAAAILEEFGGKDELSKMKAKAEGLDEKSAEYEARNQELQNKVDTLIEEGDKKYESALNKYRTEQLKNTFQSEAIKHFRDETLQDVTELAINRGLVKKGDESEQLVVKDGEGWKPFQSGGADILKEQFKYAVKDEKGTGEGTGDNRGNTGGGGPDMDHLKEIMGVN